MKDLYNDLKNFDLSSRTDKIREEDLDVLCDALILRKSDKCEIIFGFETNDSGVRKFIDDYGYGYAYYFPIDYENGTFIITKYYFIN